MDLSTRELGRVVKRARVSAGYSQAGFAAEIGVSKSTVNRWEKGERAVLEPWAVAVLAVEVTGASRAEMGLSPAPDGAEDPALLQPQIDRLRSDVARLGQLLTEQIAASGSPRTAPGPAKQPPGSGELDQAGD